MQDPSGLLAVLLTLLFPIAFICCVGALIVIAFFVFIRLSSKTFTATPEKPGPDFLADAVPTLMSWNPERAFADLAARWVGWYRSISGVGRRSGGHYQGVVRSLSRPDDGWLAFTIDRTHYWNAVTHLHTSNNHLEITLNYETIGAFNASGGVGEVRFDGQPLGSIHLPGGELFDPVGNALGRYARQTSGIQLRTHPIWNRVEIEGRVVAEINAIWFRLPRTTRRPFPALHNLIFDLTPTEGQWLLALLAIELYYDGLWRRRID